VRAVVNFAKESIKAANDADHSWRDLGASVRNVGGDYEALRPQIEKTLEAIGNRDVFDPDELAAGMARMVDMTHDSALSLEAMSAAADLARAKEIPLQQAVELIGRALETGNTRGLVPFVGKLKEGVPVLGQIHKALGDVTERMTPFERSTGLLRILWDDFHEAIGGALIEAGQGGSILDNVTGVLRAMIGWLKENKSEIAAWASGFVTAIKLTLIPTFAILRWDFGLVKAAWYALVAAFQGVCRLRHDQAGRHRLRQDDQRGAHSGDERDGPRRGLPAHGQGRRAAPERRGQHDEGLQRASRSRRRPPRAT